LRRSGIDRNDDCGATDAAASLAADTTSDRIAAGASDLRLRYTKQEFCALPPNDGLIKLKLRFSACAAPARVTISAIRAANLIFIFNYLFNFLLFGKY
jgi:hypothetical protein